MEILKPTKLEYLNYEDLITLNALHNAMQYVLNMSVKLKTFFILDPETVRNPLKTFF
ncbi:hypothetical protein SAMN05428949_5539 [Chitinophaga sp. YR627]|nr:hypothetical protein SAMN05428949_5539 [Chitinophaga sp. YR627]